MVSAGGATNLMGGRSEAVRLRVGRTDDDPVQDDDPCGRVKGHERNQTSPYRTGGGREREDTRVRIERTKVETQSQTSVYRSWNHTLKVIATP
jgi:hypothetical protein